MKSEEKEKFDKTYVGLAKQDVCQEFTQMHHHDADSRPRNHHYHEEYSGVEVASYRHESDGIVRLLVESTMDSDMPVSRLQPV